MHRRDFIKMLTAGAVSAGVAPGILPGLAKSAQSAINVNGFSTMSAAGVDAVDGGWFRVWATGTPDTDRLDMTFTETEVLISNMQLEDTGKHGQYTYSVYIKPEDPDLTVNIGNASIPLDSAT